MTRSSRVAETSPFVSGHIRRFGDRSIIVHPRAVTIAVVLILLSAVITVTAMTIGSMHIPFFDVVATLVGNAPSASEEKVILTVRLPRVLAGLAAGAALGASGAAFQSISRNPLGSPDIIGFTTGAATGALMQIIVFEGSPLAVAVSAVVGGLATAIVVYLLSMKDGASGGYRLILTGIGVGATLSGLNNLLLVKGQIDNAIAANVWLAGSLDGRTWANAVPVLIGTLIVLPMLAMLARPLSYLEMGDDTAAQLGVHVERTRRGAIFLAVLLAALATAAIGPIAFIALAAPQLVRRLTGSNGVPVLGGALMGMCLLMGADVVAQLLPTNLSLPVGRMTGIIGGIYLIWLLARQARN